jgi:hypothetical protein
MPHRRTLATNILFFARSDAAFAPPSWLGSAAYAGSWGTGSPPPPSVEFNTGRLWAAHPLETALAASEGRMPRAQPPSSERRAWMPAASVRREGVGSPKPVRTS